MGRSRKKILETGKIIELTNDSTLISKDGTEYQIANSGAPILDSENNIKGVVLVIRNITDQYKIGETLQKSEEKFRILTETSGDGIISTDKKGAITYINPAFKSIFHNESEELIGRHFKKIFTMQSAFIAQRIFTDLSLMKRKYAKNINLGVSTKNDKIIPVEVSITPLIRDNKFTGMMCLVRDISERKQAKKALWESNERYRQFI